MAEGEEEVIRFTVPVFPWVDWVGLRPNCLRYLSQISDMALCAPGGKDACPTGVILLDGTSSFSTPREASLVGK